MYGTPFQVARMTHVRGKIPRTQSSCTRLSSATVHTCQHNSNLMRQWKPVHSVQANVLQISENYSFIKWSRTDCTDLLRKTECSGCAEDLGTTSSFLCRRCSAELESKEVKQIYHMTISEITQVKSYYQRNPISLISTSTNEPICRWLRNAVTILVQWIKIYPILNKYI